MRADSIMIHAQVTLIGKRSPILGASTIDSELPQLAVEIPRSALPISEKKFAESVARLGMVLLEQARKAGVVKA